MTRIEKKMTKRRARPGQRDAWAVLAAGVISLAAASADARPEGPEVFCATYSDAPGCEGRTVSCSQCHLGPPTLNAYGLTVGGALWVDPEYSYDPQSYIARLPDALAAAEGEDSDLDGTNNMVEIELGTFPGDELSHWVEPALPSGLPNPFYDLGSYDAEFAFRRLGITYCGQSPSYAEMQAFADASDQAAALHEKLDDCLETDFWKNEALHRMADKRIRPLKAVGAEGEIMLADYDWDYRLFSYVLSGGRDARDLLLADYHVDEGEEIVEGEIDMLPGSIAGGIPIRVGTGQPLEPENRAGMITTQWYLVTFTMFTPIPRTTAAQAYRAYLGQDIAKGEGIHPVQGEPRDVDGKGVTQPTCAACHSTLDPLSYAFSEYVGIEINPVGSVLFGANPNGTYDTGRDGAEFGQDSVLFGSQVNSVVEWAQVAAESDEFKRNLADMFWTQALTHGPRPSDNTAFTDLMNGLPSDNYSVNAMLHRFIDTDAFGAP